MKCKHKNQEWVCKKHGKNCRSYAVGIVEDANEGKFESISNKELELIKKICSDCEEDVYY